MPKQKIDRSLSKLRHSIIDMLDTLTHQYEHAKSLIRKQPPLKGAALKMIHKFHQNIQQDQYVFFESSV